MFRVMDLVDGKVVVTEGIDLVLPPPEGVLRWIDLTGQDDAQLETLRAAFDFHPLTIEDCAQVDHRPKLEEYRDCLFVVTQAFACTTEKVTDLELRELHCFLGMRFLVTVHLEPITSLESTWKRVSRDASVLGRGVDFVYYLVADGMVDEMFPILDRVTDELDAIEDAVLSNPDRRDFARMFDLKHHLVTMRKVLSPQRDVMGLLAKRGDPRVTERTALYLRDTHDHLVRINESIDANRDLLGNALDAYLTGVGQRTNEIMKYLAVMSAVFLPLAFIVGFFGQNFDNLPFMKDWVHSDQLMWSMIAICVATPVGMLAWFRHKTWL